MVKLYSLEINVIMKLLQRQVWSNILSVNMKVSDILVLNAIIKLQYRKILRVIFSQHMNNHKQNTIVISVITKLHNKIIWRHIFSSSMKKSTILVIIEFKYEDLIIKTWTLMMERTVIFLSCLNPPKSILVSSVEMRLWPREVWRLIESPSIKI